MTDNEYRELAPPEGERPRVDAAPPAEPTPDPDCVCSGNWRTLVKEYEPLIGKHFRDRHTGEVYTFYGLVHSDDDFYYGLSGGKEGKGRLDSCVGSLEHFYEQLDDAAPAAEPVAQQPPLAAHSTIGRQEHVAAAHCADGALPSNEATRLTVGHSARSRAENTAGIVEGRRGFDSRTPDSTAPVAQQPPPRKRGDA